MDKSSPPRRSSNGPGRQVDPASGRFWDRSKGLLPNKDVATKVTFIHLFDDTGRHRRYGSRSMSRAAGRRRTLQRSVKIFVSARNCASSPGQGWIQQLRILRLGVVSSVLGQPITTTSTIICFKPVAAGYWLRTRGGAVVPNRSIGIWADERLETEHDTLPYSRHLGREAATRTSGDL